MADQSRQPDGSEIDQGHAEAATEDPEGGVLRDHPHIRPQRQFHAAGDRETLHRRDYGFRQTQPAWPHRRNRIVTADLAFFMGVAGCHRLEVSARTKVSARAGKDGHRGGGIGVERPERIEQFPRCRAIDGVTTMRTVDRDDGDRSVVFNKHRIDVGHVSGSLYGFWLGTRSRSLPRIAGQEPSVSPQSIPSRTKATRMVGSPIASCASSKRTRRVMTCSGWKCPATTWPTQSGISARALTRPIRSWIPTPYMCRSGTGVVSVKSPYMRWQIPFGSADRNASKMLASEAAASTTIGNNPMGSIARPFGAS